MLLSLHIENMAVISRLDLDLSAGLSVFTGETGAGKSVMIDSLLFLLGGKPKRDLVRHGEDRAIVAGVFCGFGSELHTFLADSGFDCGEEILLQRTISADGKTQCRLDGRVIPQGMLREISRRLVNIHGQNDNQTLLSAATQRKILDASADIKTELLEYRAEFQKHTEIQKKIEGLRADMAERERLHDILKFQISEIDAARLKVGEEEALLSRRTKLQYAEKIAKQSEFVYRVLYGSEKGAAALLLERAAQSLQSISDVIPEAAVFSAKLSEMRYEVEDIANTARDFADEADGDPTAALNRVEERLDLITKLCRKYGADVREVLAFRADAAGRLAAITNSEDTEAELQKQLMETEKVLFHRAAMLTKARTAAANALSARVQAELAFLDMPAVRFEISVQKTEKFNENGMDEVAFLLSANQGEPLMPLSRVASGGELSRVMLTVQSVLNRMDGVETVVFDEVDTGISGKTARKIGLKLKEIGTDTQVICVTHSAQIASLADTHFKIAKHEENKRTFTTVEALDPDARIFEIARILGGISVTETQLDAAREMIAEGQG